MHDFGVPISVTTGDVIGNGNDDVIISEITPTGKLHIYTFDNGAITEEQTIDTYCYYPVVATGDVNGDFYTDIALLYENNTRVKFLLNDGNGAFYDPNDGYQDPFFGYSNASLALADLNDDYKADLIFGAYSGDVKLYYNNSLLSNNIVNSKKTQIKLFPNPAHNIIEVTTVIQPKTNSVLKIFDQNGRVVVKKRARQHQILDLSTFKPGVYYIKINELESKKFIKE